MWGNQLFFLLQISRGHDTFNIFIFFAMVTRQSAALSFATQHAMPPEFGGKWLTKCLSTRFPLLPAAHKNFNRQNCKRYRS